MYKLYMNTDDRNDDSKTDVLGWDPLFNLGFGSIP